MTDDKRQRLEDFGLVGRGGPPSRDGSPGGLAPPGGGKVQALTGLTAMTPQ